MFRTVLSLLYNWLPVNKKTMDLTAAAYIARYAYTNIKYVRNVIRKSFKFGDDRDEVSYGTCKGVKFIYFMGSDVSSSSPDELVDTLKEWTSNVKVYLREGDKYFDNFAKQLLASLPPSHKTTDVVFVGYSRGGFTMSAFTKYMSPCAAIFLASPGEYIDTRTYSEHVYSFGHQLDPVYNLSLKSPIHAHKTHVFKGTRGQKRLEYAKKSHIDYESWLREIESEPSKDLFCK